MPCHEDQEFAPGSAQAPSQQPRGQAAGPAIRHQQDQSALQGPSGLDLAMRPGPRFCLKLCGAPWLCVAALTLALVLSVAPRWDAAAQESPSPRVDQLEGAAPGESEPELIEPDEMAPNEMAPDQMTRPGEAAPGQVAKPDTKQGGDEALPPRSTEESKRDKLDLSTDNLPLSDPVERPKMLANLYD